MFYGRALSKGPLGPDTNSFCGFFFFFQCYFSNFNGRACTGSVLYVCLCESVCVRRVHARSHRDPKDNQGKECKMVRILCVMGRGACAKEGMMVGERVGCASVLAAGDSPGAMEPVQV